MLEHIYVPSSDKVYTNGVTFSAMVSFIGIAKDSKVDIYQYLAGWFFDDSNNVKDLITEHNVADRVNELNNETHIKSLQYGDSLSVSESVRNNSYVVFSKFDDHLKVDNIRNKLHQLFDYLMQPQNIVISFYGPKDVRAKYHNLFDSRFGKLVSKNIELPHNSIISPQIKYKKGDILYVNSNTDTSNDSVYIVPVPHNSSLFCHPDAVGSMLSSGSGAVSMVYPLFSFSGEYKYFLEVRVSHNNTLQQASYHSEFKNLLRGLEKIGNINLEKDPVEIMDILFHCTKFPSGVHREYDYSAPSEFVAIFITNNPQYKKGLVVNSVTPNPIDSLKKDLRSKGLIIPSNKAMYQYACTYDIIKDIMYKNTPIPKSIGDTLDYYQLYFPLTYENVIVSTILTSVYPSFVRMLHNQLIVDPRGPGVMRMISNPTYLRMADIPRSYIPSLLINLRSYCLMEPFIDYDRAVELLLSNRLMTVQLTRTPIYYTPRAMNYANDLFLYEYPFSYFIHILKDYEQLSYSNIIRQAYKQAGIIYWGDICNYGSYQMVRGIMS